MSALAARAIEPTAEQQLAEARRAYRNRESAKRKLAHLRTYRGHTAGMRYEADQALRTLRESDETLDRILGGGA